MPRVLQLQSSENKQSNEDHSLPLPLRSLYQGPRPASSPQVRWKQVPDTEIH